MAADMVYPALFGYTYLRLTGLLLAGTPSGHIEKTAAAAARCFGGIGLSGRVLPDCRDFRLPRSTANYRCRSIFYRCQICGRHADVRHVGSAAVVAIGWQDAEILTRSPET